MKCPKCQFENPEGHKFCSECGLELKAGPFEKPRPIPDAERKRVTALFSDLSGYTAMTEKLDPEEVKEITSRIFDGTREIIKKYDGFIERFAGDGFLALFGVPKAHEDDPIRAIRAAREIHEFVDALNPRYEMKVGRALSMHSGINTGLAVTADVDPEKGTHGVTGEAINLGARLSDLAEAHEILVGSETYKACKNYFTFQSLDSVKVKGKTDLIVIHKVIDSKVSATKSSTNRQIFSKMVGRDKEIDLLEAQILKAINGKGSVINVIGEAGIGKSRLIAELKNRDLMKQMVLLEGRAISIGKNLSFHPIIDLLKQWANIAENDTRIRAFDKLEKAVRSIHPEEKDEILPFLAILMGMKLQGKYDQRVRGLEGEALDKFVVKNVRELMIKGSEQRPTVVIMEDLHWADTSSIELLETLYRLVEKHRLLFINVFRPDYLEDRNQKITTIGQRLPIGFVKIELRPLEKSNSQILIQNMLKIKGLPHSIRDQVVDRSGGNPFFIEEVVRSLIDQGAIVKTDTGFKVTELVDSIVIPPTINDVIIARVDRLEERTKELVKIASVIGRCFFDRIIKDVADSIGDVENKLRYCKNIQLISDRIRMQELEYLFKHALAHEAVYESTLIEQRKTLHKRVAQSIEKIFQERLHEFYGILAYHYGKGGDLGKTEEYMILAGEEALRSSASSEALEYFKDALNLYENRIKKNADPLIIASFEKNIATAYYNKGQWEDSINYFDKVLAKWSKWGVRHPKKPFGILFKMITDLIIIRLNIFFPFHGQMKVADEQTNEFFKLSFKKNSALFFINPKRVLTETIGEVRETFKYDLKQLDIAVEYHMGLCALFSNMGLFGMSDHVIEHTKNLINKNNVSHIMVSKTYTTLCYYLSGNWKEIPEYDVNFFDVMTKKGFFYYTATYSYWCGASKAYKGDFSIASKLLNDMELLVESYQYSGVAIYTLAVELSIMRWQLLKARIESGKLVALARERHMNPFVLQGLGWSALIQVALGDFTQAKESLKQAEEIRKKQKFWPSWYLSCNLLAKFTYDLGILENTLKGGSQDSIVKFKIALKSGKAAVKNSKKFAAHRVWNYRLMGIYYWIIGKQKKALNWWGKSIQEGKRLGARPDLSRTYFEVGKRLLNPKSKYKELNGIEAKGYLEKAGILFEEMGLERDLDDLDRLKADYGL